MKDWLGQNYEVGSRVLFPSYSSHSIALGTVMKIYEREERYGRGAKTCVQILPEKSTGGYGTTKYYDTRAGKYVEVWRDGTHVKTPSHWRNKITGETAQSYPYGRETQREHWEHVPRVYQPWIEVRQVMSPVTLDVHVNNITVVPDGFGE